MARKPTNAENPRMSNALKKTCVAVAGVLVSVSSPLSAYTSDVAAANAPSNPPPNREKPSSLCCPTKCSPSQYAGPNCITSCHCKEINLRGEALYSGVWTNFTRWRSRNQFK